MSTLVYSVAALPGGESSKVAVSTTSAQSAIIGRPSVVVTADVNVFMRRGTNPTALSTGVDQFLLANQAYRIFGLRETDKLAFISAGGTGNVYLTPDAG